MKTNLDCKPSYKVNYLMERGNQLLINLNDSSLRGRRCRLRLYTSTSLLFSKRTILMIDTTITLQGTQHLLGTHEVNELLKTFDYDIIQNNLNNLKYQPTLRLNGKQLGYNDYVNSVRFRHDLIAKIV